MHMVCHTRSVSTGCPTTIPAAPAIPPTKNSFTPNTQLAQPYNKRIHQPNSPMSFQQARNQKW